MFYTLNNAKYNKRNSLLQNQNIFGPTLKKSENSMKSHTYFVKHKY